LNSSATINPQNPGDPLERRAIRKQLVSLALPSIADYLLKMMVGVVDTIFVGRLGPQALAVSGLSWAILFYCYMPMWGMNAGVSAVVARYWGAGEYDKARRAAGQALMLNLLMPLVVTVMLVIWGKDFLRLMGATPNVVEMGGRYLGVLVSTTIYAGMMFGAQAILKATGDTRSPMLITGIINILNVGLDYCLIYGKFGFPAHGVIGAAEASAIVKLLGAFLAVGGLFIGVFKIKVTPSDFARIDWDMMKRIIRIGWPTMMENGFFSLASTAFTWVITSLGTTALAAHTVILRAESFSYMPGIGFSIASGIIVGQSIGAGNREKARMAVWESIKMGSLIMGSMGVVFFFVPHLVIRIFTDSPEVIAQGVETLRILAIIQPVQGLMFCLLGSLKGAGDTAATMKISMVGLWLIRVPGAYVLAVLLGLGVTGAWVAMCLDIAFKAMWLLRRYRHGGWLDVKI